MVSDNDNPTVSLDVRRPRIELQDKAEETEMVECVARGGGIIYTLYDESRSRAMSTHCDSLTNAMQSRSLYDKGVRRHRTH